MLMAYVQVLIQDSAGEVEKWGREHTILHIFLENAYG